MFCECKYLIEYISKKLFATLNNCLHEDTLYKKTVVPNNNLSYEKIYSNKTIITKNHFYKSIKKLVVPLDQS